MRLKPALVLTLIPAFLNACTRVLVFEPRPLQIPAAQLAPKAPTPPEASVRNALQTPDWQLQRGLIPITHATPREQELAKAVAIVIHTDDGAGTGFFISPDGLFLTNAHVIPAIGCSTARCSGVRLIRDFWSGGEKEVYSELKLLAFSRPLQIDPQAPLPGGSDFALFRVQLPPGKTVPYLPLDFTDPTQIPVLRNVPARAIGHPLTGPAHSVRLQLNAVHTVESMVTRESRVETFLMTSLILPGSSGSPMVNLETGKAIGIVHSIAHGGTDLADLDPAGHPRGHPSFGSTARQILQHLETALPGAENALNAEQPAQALSDLAAGLSLVHRFRMPGLPYPWQIWSLPYTERDELLSLMSLDENKHPLSVPTNTVEPSDMDYFHRFVYGAVESTEAARLANLDTLLSERRTPQERLAFAEGVVRMAAYSGLGAQLPVEELRRLAEKLITDAEARGPTLAYALARMAGIPVQGTHGETLDCARAMTESAPSVLQTAAFVIQYCGVHTLPDSRTVLEAVEAELQRLRALPVSENPEAENIQGLILSAGEIGPVAWSAAHVATKRGLAQRQITPDERAQALRILGLLREGAPLMSLRMTVDRTQLELSEERISWQPFRSSYRILTPEERGSGGITAELSAYLTERRATDQRCDTLSDLEAHPECLQLDSQ